MITCVEALNFRCLRDVQQPLERFHVLVGPNGSGKSTFLDSISFVGRLLSDGPDAALEERTTEFCELVWRREHARFELAIEAQIPDPVRSQLARPEWNAIRHEVAVGTNGLDGGPGILAETVLLLKRLPAAHGQRELFPCARSPRPTILMGSKSRGRRTVANKNPAGLDHFYSEVLDKPGKGWMPTFRLGPKRSALANLPEDETQFPAATWLKWLLTTGVQRIALNAALMQKASPPAARRKEFQVDGSNLPWIVHGLETASPDRLRRWVAHLRTALPDLETIQTRERPDDRHRYLVLCYEGGLHIPSWLASDGTLRLLALTLPAYLPGVTGIYLIEEPENGIHPRAIETVVQSLSSVYDAQVLLATHSPVVLSTVDADAVLCFSRDESGATDIVRGREHPRLAEWRGEENLSVLFAAGVLG